MGFTRVCPAKIGECSVGLLDAKERVDRVPHAVHVIRRDRDRGDADDHVTGPHDAIPLAAVDEAAPPVCYRGVQRPVILAVF